MNESDNTASDLSGNVRPGSQVSVGAGSPGCVAEVLTSLGIGCVLVDGDARITWSNTEGRRLCGWTPEAAPQGNAVDLVMPVTGLPEAVRLLLGTAARRQIVHATIKARDLRLSLLGRGPEDSRCVLVVIQDVTGQACAQDSIREPDRYDALTGLPGRAQFMRQLQGALQDARRDGDSFALVYLDLDRFKEINSTRGHLAGDAVLAQTGARLRNAAFSCRAMARLGDDAFAIATGPMDRDGAAAVVTRAISLIGKPVKVLDEMVSVGVSAGVAMFPDDGSTLDDLYRHADMAMYQAKAAGGGWRFYSTGMSVEMDARVRLAERLANAESGGELELHFQPQICLRSGSLAGVEALLRWRDPAYGWISPAEFIPVAEERGMMGAVGTWVLETACAQLRDWRDAGLHLPGRLAFNVSAYQLDDPGIVESLLSTVMKAGVQPTDLEN
ncbi:MAG: diguanylate cyclase [Paraburkholderia tropica]|uniref:putative bifunctional diguanylate cyclase/phosphodiesterase n=1 Tax=Paraburkholderia tropica TaxID=92647 RepID=UPI003100FB8A